MRRETKLTGVFTRRALLVGGAQLGALGLLAGKLYQVQVIEGARYKTLSDSNRISAIAVLEAGKPQRAEASSRRHRLGRGRMPGSRSLTA